MVSLVQKSLLLLFLIGCAVSFAETCTAVDAVTSATNDIKVTASSQACETTASIIWNEKHGDGSGYMEYGVSTGYGTKANISGKSGTVNLTGLKSGTTYYYHFYMSNGSETPCNLSGSFKTNSGAAANKPPVITSAPAVTCTTGTTKTYTATATDADSDPITFTTSALPSWITFASPTLTLKPLITGKDTISLFASDGKGGLDTLKLAVTRVATTSIRANVTIEHPVVFKIGTTPIVLPITADQSFSVSLYASNGARVFSRVVSTEKDMSAGTMALTGLKAGIYVVKVASKSFMLSQKILIRN